MEQGIKDDQDILHKGATWQETFTISVSSLDRFRPCSRDSSAGNKHCPYKSRKESNRKRKKHLHELQRKNRRQTCRQSNRKEEKSALNSSEKIGGRETVSVWNK
jgi:hypothetical protein